MRVAVGDAGSAGREGARPRAIRLDVPSLQACFWSLDVTEYASASGKPLAAVAGTRVPPRSLGPANAGPMSALPRGRGKARSTVAVAKFLNLRLRKSFVARLRSGTPPAKESTMKAKTIQLPARLSGRTSLPAGTHPTTGGTSQAPHRSRVTVDLGTRFSVHCEPFFPRSSTVPPMTKSRWVERSRSRLLRKGRSSIDPVGKASVLSHK